MNAMAVDLSADELIDPFQGRVDLGRGRVRCVGDPVQRFAEDGLRPLRALRFAGVFGFRLDPATRAALPGAVAAFVRVAWERKRDEMSRLLADAIAPSYALRVLGETGMLADLAGDGLSTGRAALAAVDRVGPGAPWLRFACWAAASRTPTEEAVSVMERWRLPTRDIRTVRGWMVGAASLGKPPAAPRGADLRRWVALVGTQHAVGAAQLAAALHPKRYARFPAAVRRLLARSPALTLADLAISGDDLATLGLRGPAVGRTLQFLLRVVLDNPRQNQRRILLDLAHDLSTGVSESR
jgi:tRNA nucleotidyltransferase (CCA-adding enzyme)